MALLAASCGGSLSDTRGKFSRADDGYRPRPLWFWNNTTVTKEGVREQMEKLSTLSGYGGVSIIPFGPDFRPGYLSEEYFEVYGEVIAAAKDLGMTVWLYDEYGFPSGSAGYHHGNYRSLFVEQYPQFAMKSLFKSEYIPGRDGMVNAVLPSDGDIMSVVALDTVSFERIDLTGEVTGRTLSWKAPEGKWKVIASICKPDGEPLIDYLDDEAARYYTQMTHDKYYEHFGEDFGDVIVGTFFDEPTLYRQGGSNWTPLFNEKFEQEYGFSPTSLYPALWYDIGEKTREARNLLFGMRAQLYAEGYTKVVDDWSRAHGVRATGHQDNEERVNPVGTSGDLMKCFKHLEIPGVDKIGNNGGFRPAERYYKIISSAAYNWDKSFVMSETYGDMGNIPWSELYSVAMDQYSKGINVLIPHAVWYDDTKVTFNPELSYRNLLYSDGLYDFNTYLARLNVMLANEGRVVNNIAVYYPIETLQGEHYLEGPLDSYMGGVEIPDMDYVDIGMILADTLGRDYTFLHPEVLSERCKVRDSGLRLDNMVQWNDFSALFIPSCKTISLENLRKAVDFYNNGGTLVFTTQLPSGATMVADNVGVKEIMDGLFPQGSISSSNAAGGRAFFIARPSAAAIATAISHLPNNLVFEGTPVRNITKEIDGKKRYFFANPTADGITTSVLLPGKSRLELWNPHTGSTEKAGYRSEGDNTVVDIRMAPYSSLFIVEL